MHDAVGWQCAEDFFAVLQAAFDSSDEIRKRILEFVQEQAIMTGQIAGCNRLHGAEERLVRWLLMAQDRTHTDILKFTHEYLAEMIGTQRTTMTVLAGDLQARGLISYSRGSIRILNREALEAITCDCYAISKRLYTNLYSRDAKLGDAVENHVVPNNRGDEGLCQHHLSPAKEL
jgi:Crp-like helix-turn-helix domain